MALRDRSSCKICPWFHIIVVRLAHYHPVLFGSHLEFFLGIAYFYSVLGEIVTDIFAFFVLMLFETVSSHEIKTGGSD